MQNAKCKMQNAKRERRLCFSILHFAFCILHCSVVLLFACHKEPATQHDALGRPVSIPTKVRRIVTLTPNVTEILYAIGAGDRIVATDDFSNYPAAAKKLPKVGGLQPNVEKIVSLRPDLVIASTEGNQPNLAQALAAADVPLYVVRTDRLADIAATMRTLGSLLGAKNVDAVASQLERNVAAQRRSRPQHARLLFAVWTDPLYVAGHGTFTDDLFELTGADNAVTASGWPQYSLETLVATPPDIILYPRGAVTPQAMEALLAKAPGIHPRIIPVNEDVFQRPGPRMVEAARTLNEILDHPPS
jgi:iron complex transport system substrate-binding protein